MVSGFPFEKQSKVQIAMYRMAAWCLDPTVTDVPYCSVFFHKSGSASNKPLCCLVSVRVGLKGTGIDDSLVVHQLVALVVWIGVEIVGFASGTICYVLTTWVWRGSF